MLLAVHRWAALLHISSGLETSSSEHSISFPNLSSWGKGIPRDQLTPYTSYSSLLFFLWMKAGSYGLQKASLSVMARRIPGYSYLFLLKPKSSSVMQFSKRAQHWLFAKDEMSQGSSRTQQNLYSQQKHDPGWKLPRSSSSSQKRKGKKERKKKRAEYFWSWDLPISTETASCGRKLLQFCTQELT